MTTIPIDKTRRKRLKVVSACGECRRKKTKCNGENPCTGCIKAKVECKYVTSHKTRTFVRSPAMMMSTDKSQPMHPLPQQQMQQQSPQQHHHQQHQHQQQQQQPPVSVEAIEERLGVIEDILRALLKAQPSTLQLPVFGGSGAYHPRHAPHSQNWHMSNTPPITPTPRRPTSAFHLPPLRESSSTTSSSSTSSSSSCTSIRNLLNDDDTLPTPPLTATFQKTHHQHHPPRVYYADEFR